MIDHAELIQRLEATDSPEVKHFNDEHAAHLDLIKEAAQALRDSDAALVEAKKENERLQQKLEALREWITTPLFQSAKEGDTATARRIGYEDAQKEVAALLADTPSEDEDNG